MLPGKVYKPEDVIQIVVRNKWVILLPFALGLAAVPFIAERLPELYRSVTLMMVVPQRIPDSFVRSTVTATVEDRLTSITEQILSRSRLERIINDFDLYRDQRAHRLMEDIVSQMRSDIEVAAPDTPLQSLGTQPSFQVSFVSTDPATAQKVTARLAALYIEENLRERENLAENTSVFLQSQLEEAKLRLVEHERKLEAYRRRHAGELPTQLESNLQIIQSAQMQVQSINDSINRARERRLLVERQIADTESPLPQPGTPDGESALPTAQQLAAAHAELETFKLRYTPDHPDVRALERTIRELDVRVAEEAKRPKERQISPAEVAKQRRLRDLRDELNGIDRQIASSQAEELSLRDTIATYRVKVEAVPSRESELVALTRDYGTLQETYESLLAKGQDSKLSANLERRQIGEQFRILDPASLPQRPSNQTDRIGIMFSAAFAGLLLGVGYVGFREYRDSSFTHEEDVSRVLGLPVLALVPVMASDRERRARRTRGIIANAAAVFALLGSVAVLVVWGMRP